ncbi:DUF397 domain-containing protein [Actinomadura hibisca]|uniref:DUF397 domain-containing protein n=1 Tax=Actinomadura hibisca TaxID=68565 RepID=UPI000A07239A|nr:DUF397 domain-containing protein [Actinomadura hibisca]
MVPISTGWRKSTHSGGNGGECVELATSSNTVAVRDSKDPEGPNLLLNRDDFRRLASMIKSV